LCAHQLFKYTQFDKYHTLELVLLVLYSYSSYLLADGLGLSGTAQHCPPVLAHSAQCAAMADPAPALLRNEFVFLQESSLSCSAA
jgi:hypothetical protein